MVLVAWVLSACLAGPAAAAPPEILVDGNIADWTLLKPALSDPHGDRPAGTRSGVDFGRLWITHDAHAVHLLVELGTELSLQSGNALRLLLDTDADSATGILRQGLGVDVEWSFGGRRGRAWAGHGAERREQALEHQDLGLVTAPTVTSDRFEIHLARDALLPDGSRLFPGKELRVALADQSGDGGDRLPDLGGVSYLLDGEEPAAARPIALGKYQPSHLRVLSFNTNDHLLETGRHGAYRRILRALKPDLVLLQEVRKDSVEAARNLLAPMLPASVPFRPAKNVWHAAKVGGESSVILSPFPIRRTFDLGESGAFLLAATSSENPDAEILLVALSTPCCDKDVERQEEMNRIMAFVRDAKRPGGDLALAPGTPILVIGDANLVGRSSQYRILLEGAVTDRNFGEPFAPDWDSTPFTDLAPRHTHRRHTFTWYGDSFSPGRLDFAFVSDSVVGVGNRFVLFTPTMPAAALAAAGLQHDDTMTASDHLPMVVDLILPK